MHSRSITMIRHLSLARMVFLAFLFALAFAISNGIAGNANAATTAEELDRDSRASLEKLYQTHPVAKDISNKALAVIIFPNIVKAGLVFGGGYGEGELLVDGK